jgi:hypothetical protein
MPAEVTTVGSAPCILEPRPHIWDLGGTMTATFADKSNPAEPVGFINSNQVLQVTVTVTLTGKILNYLCNTSLCVCLAFEACGCGPSGDICEWIKLTGDDSPCRTNVWTFVFDVPAGTFNPGECGREYHLCITLGSKDCCGKVGFVYGSCGGGRDRSGGSDGDHGRAAGREPGARRGRQHSGGRTAAAGHRDGRAAPGPPAADRELERSQHAHGQDPRRVAARARWRRQDPPS